MLGKEKIYLKLTGIDMEKDLRNHGNPVTGIIFFISYFFFVDQEEKN